MAVAAARDILAAEGLPGLSARKVAGEIGYTVGMLYVAFANLDELILAANAATLDDLYQQLRRATRSCRTAESCLHALARAYLRFAEEHRLRWLAVFAHRLPAGSTAPDWYGQKVARLFELVETQITALDGTRFTTKEIATAATALWSGVHGIAILALDGKLAMRGDQNLNRLVETLVENFLRGMTSQ